MARLGKFFIVRQREWKLSGNPYVEVSAGTTATWPGGNQSQGAIWIALDPELSSTKHKVGRLLFPDQATLEFHGSLTQMRALWMKHGSKDVFLHDPRFEFVRL